MSKNYKQPAAQPLFSHELEAELLGAALLGKPAALEAVASMSADDFTAAGHPKILEALQEQVKRGQETDVIAVLERLRSSGSSDADDGLLERLVQLSQSSYAEAGTLRRAAQSLRELTQRRVLLHSAQSAPLADTLALVDSIKASTRQGDEIDLLDVGHILDDAPPGLDFVLPGLLAGTVGMLVSPGATGKTMLAAQLAALVACGQDSIELGQLSELGRVVYLTGEDPAPVMHARLHSLGRQMTGQQRQLLRENLQVADLIGRGADLLDPAWQGRVSRLVKGARLVVLDTLRRFHCGDENDSGEMAQLLAVLERLCRDAGTTILALHHTSKSGAREGAGEQQAARGSSVLTDNARLQLNLVRMNEKEATDRNVSESMRGHFIRLVFAKMNYCAPIQDLWLHRKLGGVLERAHFGTAGAVATRQPLPGARIEDSVRRGGVVMDGGHDDDF